MRSRSIANLHETGEHQDRLADKLQRAQIKERHQTIRALTLRALRVLRGVFLPLKNRSLTILTSAPFECVPLNATDCVPVVVTKMLTDEAWQQLCAAIESYDGTIQIEDGGVWQPGTRSETGVNRPSWRLVL